MGKKLAIAVVLFLATSLGCLSGATSAYARLGHGEPGTQPSPPSPSGSQSGSSGAPVQKAVRACSLYATSSNFGLSCITGGAGDVRTVRDILGKTGKKDNPPPTCWDDPISAQDLQQKYEYAPNPDAPYYLHTCITGLILSNSLYYQPSVQLNQQVIEIPKGAPDCAKPYTDAMTGGCVMTLTAEQRKVVSSVNGADAQIPGITILTRPSTKVRTNEKLTFVDADATGLNVPVGKTTVGGVTLWAQMTDFKIFPYGPDGVSVVCDGSDVGPDGAALAGKHPCRWAYPKSSAGQPGQVYPFRAEADWTVYYDAGAGPRVLQSFQKYDDLSLPVSDIQTIVIR